jgi:hypothetical protein
VALMHDPRTPELFQWLDDLDLEQRLSVMHALSFAFPRLKNDSLWQSHIAAVTDELEPTPEENADIMVAAIRMSGNLKREFEG